MYWKQAVFVSSFLYMDCMDRESKWTVLYSILFSITVLSLASPPSVFCMCTDGDPKNYLAYYRRATVYLAMGKSKSALPDLSRVIELKPDFTSVSFISSWITLNWKSLRMIYECSLQLVLCLHTKARLQRGNLLLKQGKLDEAEADFKKVVSLWTICLVEKLYRVQICFAQFFTNSLSGLSSLSSEVQLINSKII